MATVKCETPCVFATLTRAKFESTFKKLEKKRIDAHVNFLMQLPNFQGQNKNKMIRQIQMYTWKKFTRKQIVYKEN